MRSFVLLLINAIVLAPLTALAGIADTPLPPGAAYLYSIPGIVNTSGYGTFVTCTSTTSDPQTVTFEVFSSAGTPAGSVSAVVPGHGTTRLGTRPAVSFVLLGADTGSGPITFGAGRISSTVKNKLICTAVVGDAANDPPVSMVSLNVIAKLKQKAAN